MLEISFRTHVKQFGRTLVNSLIDRLTNRLTGCRIDRSIDWLIFCLNEWMIDWLMDGWIDWLKAWLINELIDSLIDWLILQLRGRHLKFAPKIILFNGQGVTKLFGDQFIVYNFLLLGFEHPFRDTRLCSAVSSVLNSQRMITSKEMTCFPG